MALAAIPVLSATVYAGVLDVSWTEPTTNVDGTRLTDLAGYRLYYDVADVGCSGSTFEDIPAADATPAPDSTVSYPLTELFAGTPYFVSVTAVDVSGNTSDCLRAEQSAVAHTDFSVSPTGTTDFGSILVGDVADRTFTVQNTGEGTISGTVATSAPFTIVAGASFSLAGAGSTHVATVRFTPTVAGAVSANVNFTTASGDTISRIVTGNLHRHRHR